MESETLTLRTRTESETRIRSGRGIWSEALDFSGRTLAVIDETVAGLWPELLNRLKESSIVELVASGERSKSFANLERLVERLAEERFTRSDRVLAVGGGVVTDLAGFAASVYMRGIVYESLPTTLLAMVDASIGGKCGIDLAQGKNLAGSFYQPRRVIADADFLGTLPPSEIANGVGEIIKYGVIADETLFPLLDSFAENADGIVSRCMAIKCEVVESDERENGRRMLLNFGHTIGHAIEKLGGYSAYSHGASVANGMIFESKFLERAGIASAEDTALIERYADKFSLRIPAEFSAEAIFEGMLSDKKRRGETLNFVGFERIGCGKVFPFPIAEVKRLIGEVFSEETK